MVREVKNKKTKKKKKKCNTSFLIDMGPMNIYDVIGSIVKAVSCFTHAAIRRLEGRQPCLWGKMMAESDLGMFYF